MSEIIKANFKARSHILSLLGDELIGSDNLALFELVKNSYDADATKVNITFKNLGSSDISLIIEDDGIGMDKNVLLNSWLEIGTDFKRGENRKVSEKFKRESLGEKGVGRLAIHKLASDITLETKHEQSKSGFRLSFNWQSLVKEAKYIEDTSVNIEEIDNLTFLDGNQNGTRIILKNLKRKDWSRGDIRSIYRTINNLTSPFSSVDSFVTNLVLEDDYEKWIEDIFNPKDILKASIYEFDFFLSKDGIYSWKYCFKPPFKGEGLKKYSVDNFSMAKTDKILLNSEGKHKDKKIIAQKDLEDIGDIKGKFYLYNQRSEVLNVLSNNETVKNYLKENQGVRIYRDKLRVYNYGEPGNDWLGLNLWRANNPGKTISNNNIIGNIQLDLKYTHNTLKEKTNREGFDETQTYSTFKNIVWCVVKHFSNLIQSDREKLENHIKSFKPVKRAGFSESIIELKDTLEKKKLTKEFSSILEKLEDDYGQMREVMITSGLSGMNLSLIFHELSREVHALKNELDSASHEEIKSRLKYLTNLIEGFSPILKQNKSSDFTIKKLFTNIIKYNSGRIAYHRIVFSCPTITGEAMDFSIKGPDNLLFSALNNLIDNSIYWTSLRFEKEGICPPAILLTTNTKSFKGPAIIVADNGEGFKLTPEELTKPFKTLKPGGMGLGLYYSSLVMEMIGGEILFMNSVDVGLPKNYTGAVTVLVFKTQD